MVADSYIPIDGISVSIIDFAQPVTYPDVGSHGEAVGSPGEIAVSLTAYQRAFDHYGLGERDLRPKPWAEREVSFVGTLSEINALLAIPGSLEYYGGNAFAGVDTLTVQVQSHAEYAINGTNTLFGQDPGEAVTTIAVHTHPVARPAGPFETTSGDAFTAIILVNDGYCTDSEAHNYDVMVVSASAARNGDHVLHKRELFLHAGQQLRWAG